MVLPEFIVHTTRIFAVIQVPGPLLVGQVFTFRGSRSAGVTTVQEFCDVARPAIRAKDEHHSVIRTVTRHRPWSVPPGERATAMLIDGMAGRKALERKCGIQFMRSVLRNRMCKAPAGSRCCLETTVTPAAINVEIVDGCSTNDGAAIHTHIHNASPGSKHPQPAERGKQRHE